MPSLTHRSALEPLEPRTLLSVTPAPLRINAGGPALTDSLARPFAADSNFTGGTTASSFYDVANTPDDDLFSSYRTGPAFTFSRPVANGHYALFLDFADPTSTAAGQRTFDVAAEGALRLDDLDIVNEAGPRTALVKSLDVTVTDGHLDLAFTGVTGDAILSAIVLVSTDIPQAARAYVPAHGLYDESTQIGWARNEALKTSSASNLRNIGWFLIAYSNEHKGNLPPNLLSLVADARFDFGPKYLANPRTDTGLPRGEITHLEEVAWAAGLNDFLYLGAGKRSSQFGEAVPLVYENPDRVVGGINILRGDGSVRFYERADAAVFIGFTDAPPTHAPPAQDPLDPALRGDKRVTDSANNLRRIADALQSYANEHRGNYPATAGLLNGYPGVTPQTFVNPRGSTTPPPADLSRDAGAAWIDASADYVCLAAGKKNYAPSTDLLAFENPAEMTTGLHLLFGDLHVEFREMRWALETIARAGATARLPLPGDATRDGTVNFDDLLVLAKNYNRTDQPFTAGDFNYDNVINFDDLLLLAQNYNRTTTSTVPAAAAAPTTTSTKSHKPEVTSIRARPAPRPHPLPARKHR